MDKQINPDYIKLACIAAKTVYKTMLDGEPKHGVDTWQSINIPTHGVHIVDHIYNHSKGDTAEDHIAHCLTRCAMIKYLEANHES